ncbi:RES family NAD+ phosphorylase [Pararhizobium arenae]|uniref:RES family NAD+ phosphorylase n=1 Tax=Pararhizobium arenae TaxID=1856850 RepID=UPI00094B5AB8|nr:RES family NAD+ phosphorylase [Pararhizobium arenae]
MILWRISNYADLSGRGGLIAAGRWHEQGHPVVYCCDHPSTALLEILVHVDPEDMPEDFQLLKIRCPEEIGVFRLEVELKKLHDAGWTRREGTRLLKAAKHCLLDVPSAIMPEARNILINTQHPDAQRLVIEKTIRYPFDSRLLI